MSKQLFVIQVDRAKMYPQQAEQYKELGPDFQFFLHSGGRGNGAQAGLYTANQINRIIGRYPEGVAKAIPVAIGYSQIAADHHASEAHILGHARSHGVDNWCGWMDWEKEVCCDED